MPISGRHLRGRFSELTGPERSVYQPIRHDDLEMRLICFSNREVLLWDAFDLSENTERWSALAP